MVTPILIDGELSRDSSNSSSPRPDSILDLSTSHQREQDLHMAIGNALARTRSNTVQNSNLTPQRVPTIPLTTTRTLTSSPPRLPSLPLHSQSQSQSQGQGQGGQGRRGSVSTSTNPLEHLADDLEIEQHIFFDRSASNPSSSSNNQNNTPSQQQPLSEPRTLPLSKRRAIPSSSAAATRFYRQHRNLSESSIDSQGGAYIDHRRQPHSLSIGTGSRSSQQHQNIGSSGAGGGISRSPDGYGGSSTTRRQFSGDDSARGRSSNTMEQQQSYRDISPNSPSHGRGGGGDSSDQQSGFSTRTLRQQRQQRQQHHLSSGELEENAISLDDDDDEEDDEKEESDGEDREERERGHLERHPTHQSYTSNRSNPPLPSDSPSRHSQHSLLNDDSDRQPEEDVCFPAHGASVEVDLLDLGMGMYGDPSHGRGGHDATSQGLGGVAGVLHNFPFPFDFASLEEFATREKEGMPIPRRRGTGGGIKTNFVDDVNNSSISPPGYGTSMRNKILGDGSGSGGESGKKTMRQRKLSESVAPGRYQRNLALFEGTGEENLPPPTSSSRDRGNILDTKTPLLDKSLFGGLGGGGGGGGGYGSNVRDRPGLLPANSGQARPYRFSFYSNALPSTIHARSLAEIPAEGQSFEELFVGRKSSSSSNFDFSNEDGESVRGGGGHGGGFSHSQNGTGGANTPVGGGGGNFPPNGARPAGIATGLGGSKRNGGGDNRPKSGMMRTDIDAEANTWWLDVLCPTDQEMKVLSKVFGIHPLTTEDIQMEETREKIELFRNYYFVCFRSFEQDPYSPTYLEPLNMYIIVFREGTLSFHFRGTPHPQNVRRRIKQLKDYINVTSDWISYALIDDITDAFGPLIQNIEYEVDSIDELVLILKEAEQSDMLRRIGTCRKKVMGLLRLMGNKADVVKGLSKRCNENWSVAPKSDIGLYLSDIQDHITTSTQNLTHYEKILSRSHSNYLAQISIEMTDANNQINDVLSKLTALGTVLIPMNLITGLWGMNVNVPGQGIENLHWFFSIIGALGAIALGGAWLTYRVFVRN